MVRKMRRDHYDKNEVAKVETLYEILSVAQACMGGKTPNCSYKLVVALISHPLDQYSPQFLPGLLNKPLWIAALPQRLCAIPEREEVRPLEPHKLRDTQQGSVTCKIISLIHPSQDAI